MKKFLIALCVVAIASAGCGSQPEKAEQPVQKVEETAKVEPAPKPEPTPEEIEAKRLADEQAAEAKRLAEEEQAAELAIKQALPRVEAYMKSLPGSQLVIVKEGYNGVSVDCDYNVGDMPREDAKAYATDLIYDILDANSDCPFSSITINCMNGKSPVGALVQYDRGEIFSR